ncbi:MAG: DNA-directed DNA polymerase [archaeon]
MVKIRIFPLDYRIRTSDEGSMIQIYGKTEEGRRVCLLDGIQPFFYCQTSTMDQGMENCIRSLSAEDSSVTAISQVDMRLQGRAVRVFRVHVNAPQSVRIISAAALMLPGTVACYGHDVLCSTKYICARGILPLNLIEVEGEYLNQKSRVSVAKIHKIGESRPGARLTLNILGLDIRYEEDKIRMGLYGEGLSQNIECGIEDVKGLLSLVQELGTALETYKPDIITGFATDSALVALKQHAGARLDYGLDYSEIMVSGESAARITGIVHLDMAKYIEIHRDFSPEDIDQVATALQVAAGDSPAEKAYRIGKKILHELTELSGITGVPLYSVCRMGQSQLVEHILIRQAIQENELIPGKPDPAEIERRRRQRFKGGLVLEPQPGIFEGIAVYDFISLYPNIICAHNISPDTLRCSCCDGFCRKRTGFIPRVVENLVRRRMRVSDIAKNTKQPGPLVEREKSLKLLANSFYGYMGFAGARWYCLECAEAVASYGRKYIGEAIKKTEEKFRVIYSDTDSLFVQLGDHGLDDVHPTLERINSTLPGLMELEFEGFYRRALFVASKGGQGAKKKYALLNDDGSVSSTGFETAKRNWSRIIRDVQENVLEKVLKKDNDGAINSIRKAISRLRNNEVPIDDLIVRTTLQKNLEDYDTIGPHVAVARRMRNSGTDVGPGTIIEYVISTGPGLIRDRAKIPSETDSYDPEYYVQNQLLPAVEKILDAAGISESQIICGQSTLASYFGNHP